jgi:4-hydroxy-tetrahydrodipicolinate synthase
LELTFCLEDHDSLLKIKSFEEQMRYAVTEAKDWVRESLHGYVVCPTTPFTDDLRVDEAGVQHNVKYQLSLASTGGLYLNSVFAEHLSLTIAERKRIAEIIVAEVAGRVPVVVEVTSESYLDAIDLGNHARDIGADLVLLGVPLTGLRTREGVLEYFRRFASDTDIGIAVFTTSWADVGFHIDTDLLLELSKIDAVCVVKDATANLVEFYDKLDRVAPRMVVSRPSEQYWLAGRLVMGPELCPPLFLGTTKSLYCDHITKSFLDAVGAEDWKGARDSMMRGVRLSASIFAGHASGHHEVAATKAVTGLLGMATGPVRPPIAYPSDEVIANASRLLIEAGSLPS